MKMTGYWVYTITTPDGMVYVGMSGKKITAGRWNSKCYKETSLQPYIDKYGWENLTHDIVAEGLTKNEAQELENELILKYGNEGRRINKQGSGGWKSDIEKIREHDREYYAKNKEKSYIKHKKWVENNREKNNELARRYYYNHREEIIEKKRRSRAKKKLLKQIQPDGCLKLF